MLFGHHEWEWTLKDYDDDLVALSDPPEAQNGGGMAIDPRFVAARVAALPVLASRILSCEQRS